MKALLISTLLFLPNIAFGASASMATTWLIDKDRIISIDTPTISSYPMARNFIDLVSQSDCTRYYSITLTTTTSGQNTFILNAIANGKLSRLVDQTTIRNQFGEIVPFRTYYDFPLGWQDYSVKESTP